MLIEFEVASGLKSNIIAIAAQQPICGEAFTTRMGTHCKKNMSRNFEKVGQNHRKLSKYENDDWATVLLIEDLVCLSLLFLAQKKR